jgi:hypothetical protein
MAMARYQYQWRISWLMAMAWRSIMAVGANENGEKESQLAYRYRLSSIRHREKINQSKIWHEKKAKAGVSKAKAQTGSIENKQLIHRQLAESNGERKCGEMAKSKASRSAINQWRNQWQCQWRNAGK